MGLFRENNRFRLVVHDKQVRDVLLENLNGPIMYRKTLRDKLGVEIEKGRNGIKQLMEQGYISGHWLRYFDFWYHHLDIRSMMIYRFLSRHSKKIYIRLIRTGNDFSEDDISVSLARDYVGRETGLKPNEYIIGSPNFRKALEYLNKEDKTSVFCVYDGRRLNYCTEPGVDYVYTLDGRTNSFKDALLAIVRFRYEPKKR